MKETYKHQFAAGVLVLESRCTGDAFRPEVRNRSSSRQTFWLVKARRGRDRCDKHVTSVPVSLVEHAQPTFPFFHVKTSAVKRSTPTRNYPLPTTGLVMGNGKQVSEWVEKVRQQKGWWGRVGTGEEVGRKVRSSGLEGMSERPEWKWGQFLNLNVKKKNSSKERRSPECKCISQIHI